MISKLFAAAMLLCSFSYASAGTSAIGTVNARGNMRVDGYRVTGNATLFDGTVVETGEASVAIRLRSGAEIKLATNSRGTVYGDRLVLQRGSSELEPSGAVALEVNGMHITPSKPNSKGTVTVNAANTVEVAALTGQFRVTSGSGTLLARVDTGKSLSFDTPQVGKSQIPDATTPKGPVKMSIYGDLTRVGDYYYLNLPAPDIGYIYEVHGASLDSFIGKPVIIDGTVDVQERPVGKANYVLVVQNVREQHISTPISWPKRAILSTLVLGGAAGAAIGIYEATQGPAPASR